VRELYRALRQETLAVADRGWRRRGTACALEGEHDSYGEANGAIQYDPWQAFRVAWMRCCADSKVDHEWITPVAHDAPQVVPDGLQILGAFHERDRHLAPARAGDNLGADDKYAVTIAICRH